MICRLKILSELPETIWANGTSQVDPSFEVDGETRGGFALETGDVTPGNIVWVETSTEKMTQLLGTGLFELVVILEGSFDPPEEPEE